MSFCRYSIFFSVFFLALFVSALDCPAQPGPKESADMYNNAGKLYRDGKFQQALQIYESLLDSGIHNPDLYYNASNAAYRCGDLGKALLYIERALALAPSDEDALANRAFLNSIKKDQEPAPDNVITAFITRIYESTNVNTSTLLSGIMFASAFIIATFSIFTSGTKRIISIVFFIIFMSISILSGGISIHKLHRESSQAEAIIMTEQAKAYSGPDTQNTHIFTIHEGTKVIIERQQDGWSLIRLLSGAGGWIPASSLEEI